MSYFPPTNFEALVRSGQVAGWSTWSVLGHSNAVGTSERIVDHSMNTAALSVDALKDTPSTVKVASTSANDTNSSGTGARSVQITGLASGVITSETINLAGTSEQTSVNTYSGIFGMEVKTAGTTGSNEGIVWCGNGTFTAGQPATPYASVAVAYNLSSTGYFIVPTGYAWVLQGLHAHTGDTTKTTTMTFWIRDASSGLWLENYEMSLKGDQSLDFQIFSYPSITAGSALKVTAMVDTGTALCTLNLEGLLVPV